MMDAGRHPNIKLLTSSEVTDVSGYIGNFTVTVRQKARFVTSRCTACGDCVPVCPIDGPNEFELGLSRRKAIYQPFPQAVPSAFLIDPKLCLGHEPIACGKCAEVCGPDAIDYDDRDKEFTFEVGTVVVATGADTWDPTPNTEYGYTRYPDVVTSVEFERILAAGGPTEGHVIRPSDRKEPKRIAFIQCVGSRTMDPTRGMAYCSNFCCMETVKTTLQVEEHIPGAEQTVYYMDIRAFGKGFEELYRRSRSLGVRYVRAIPSQVSRNGNGALKLRIEDPETKEIREVEHDLVVLAVGLKPRDDSGAIQRLFTLSRSESGFFLESHPKLKPVDTPCGGVFLAGVSEGPKDIKDSVTQASAATARAGILMKQGEVTVEAITAQIDTEICTACGKCVKVCPFHAITLEEGAPSANVIEALCQGCGTCGPECKFEAIELRHFTDGQLLRQIDEALADNPQDKILAFACNWCSYAGADLAGVSRMTYPASARVIRTMCSGRVDERFVLYAFEKGPGAVLVSGCHFGDCHYIDANHYTKKRVEKLWNRMERAGFDKSRLHLAWVSAAEGQRWANLIKEIDASLKDVDPEEIQKVAEWARGLREKDEARLHRLAVKREAVAGGV
jgi:heterodisulfide reductase subunit A